MNFNYSVDEVLQEKIAATIVKSYQQQTLELINQLDPAIREKLSDISNHLKTQIERFEQSMREIDMIFIKTQLSSHLKVLGYSDAAEMIKPTIENENRNDDYILGMIQKLKLDIKQ